MKNLPTTDVAAAAAGAAAPIVAIVAPTPIVKTTMLKLYTSRF